MSNNRPFTRKGPLTSATILLVAVVVAALSSGMLRGSMPDSETGTWAVTGSLSGARGGSAAVLLPSGGVLVTGGADDSGSVGGVDLFGADGTFSPVASMTEGRADHTAVRLEDGRVLVAGGRNAAGAVAGVEAFSAGGWSPAGVLTDARWGHTATLLTDGRVLIAGGENGAGAVMSLELFDPETGAFAVAGTMAVPRKGHAAALLQDRRVLIAGGSTGEGAVASTEIFDPQTLQLSAGPSLNTPREGLSATTLLDGRVVFIGGHDGTSNLASAEVYSDVTNAITYTATSSPMVPRRGHQALLLPNNNAVLIVGGIAEGTVDGAVVERETSAAELYLPWLGEVWQTGGMTAARAKASGAALSAESYGAAPAGDGLVMVAAGAGQASSEVYRFATIRTDRDDYAPGNDVYVSGSGWQPNETVTFALRELPAEHSSRSFTISSDDLGRISNVHLFTVEEHHLGVRFFLTARAAASQAQTTFTDNQNPTIGNFSFHSPIDCSSPATPSLGAQICGKMQVTHSGGGTAAEFWVQWIRPDDSIAKMTKHVGATTGQFVTDISPTLDVLGQWHLATCRGNYPSSQHNKPCTGQGDLLAITPVPVGSLAVDAATGEYGGTVNLTATLSGTGSVGGRTVSFSLNGTSVGSAVTDAAGVATLSSASLAGIAVGTYAPGTNTGVKAAFAGDATVAAAEGLNTLTVSARPITVAADAQSKTYGAADPALTYQVTAGELVAGDSFSGALTRAAGEDVGTYAITQGTLALSSNYTLTFVGANLTINARAITVTADAKSKNFGDADPALTYQITSGTLVFGDSFSGMLARDPGEAVGEYEIRQHTLSLSSNYTLTFIGAKLRIIDWQGPAALNVTVDPNPVEINTSFKVQATIDDTLTGNSIIASAEYTVNDGVTWIPMTGAFTTPVTNVEATNSGLSSAVYQVCVRGRDIYGNIGAASCILLAVFDPAGGFVTGGGWIDSPAGASAEFPLAIGRANFGFVSKYQKGAKVPTGQTEFQFKAGNLNFHSSAYEWLVVSGCKAQYKGTGTVNGVSGYKFLLTATDGNKCGSPTPDRFRIKITDASDNVVYDNKLGAPDDMDATDPQDIASGSIVIHEQGKK